MEGTGNVVPSPVVLVLNELSRVVSGTKRSSKKELQT